VGKRILALVLAAAAVAAFAPLSITASAAEMNARIPFSFVVNGTTMLPGTYVISSVGGSNGVLQLRGAYKGALIATIPSDETHNPSGLGKLVFLKTGSRYDLLEIWSTDGRGHQLLVSRRQLEERARAAGTPAERVVIPGM
jgi:hypothetical protein